MIVKGTIFEHGREWTGPWRDANGNGPITISIPRPGDQGVVERSLPSVFARSVSEVREGPPPESERSMNENGAEVHVHGWTLAPG